MELLFPGWKPAAAKPPSARNGNAMELPKDTDEYLLFPGLPAIEARRMNDYIWQWAIESTANDPVLIKLSNPSRSRQAKIPAK
jgi:hypothetical protein